MKKYHKIYITAAIVLAAVLITAFSNDKYYKIYRNFEILTEVFKTVTNYYVSDIDPEVLVQSSIEGMLSTLDPYSVYYTEEESEDLDLINYNRYVGFGVSINKVDSMNTIIEVREGFGAWKGGIKPGDKLYEIDGNKVLRLSSDELRNYTNGEPNSIAEVKVIRFLKDTLTLTVKRETVDLKDVLYYDVLEGDIGYIYLDGFSKKAPNEVRSAIMELQNKTNLKGLILDLRGNPGGLLHSAIAISEFFVPKGSLIVYTKGREGDRVNSYHSTRDPIFPDLPLAVMINEGSASASEIVAGCIQDLDRGIVVGKTSFGKGLVQSVFSMDQNSNIKLTTAKYYTPSGRCIQKIQYGKEHLNEEKDSTETHEFYTKSGRLVLESQGITPDSVITRDEVPQYILDLRNNYLFFKYANHFVSEKDKINPKDTVAENLVADFKKFLLENEYNISTGLLNEVDELMDLAEDYNSNKNILQKINELHETIIDEKINLEKDSTGYLVYFLRREVMSRYLNEFDYYAYNVNNNNTIQNTLNIMKDNLAYKNILTTNIDTKNKNN